MVALHSTHIFDVEDCMVWPLQSDTGAASPTYGTAIDVPGIAEVGVDPEFVSAALKGDSRIIDRKARIDGLTWSLTYGKVSLDLNQIIYGGYLEDFGSGSNEVARWGMVGGTPQPYFAARFVIADVDLGLDGLVVTAYKAQVSGGTFVGSSSDNYGQPAAEIGVFQPNHLTTSPEDGGVFAVDFTPMIDMALHETLIEPYTTLP